MKLISSGPLALLLLTLGCGPTLSPTHSNDVDAATRALTTAVDNKNASEIRAALSSGAKADAPAGYASSALHFASETNDAELCTFTLNQLSVQKPSSADLAAAISQANKQGQSALEVAYRNGNARVIDALGTFCDSKKILRAVFFPVAKKMAIESPESLDSVLSSLSHYGASKNLMAHLIFETIGTKEGEAILAAHTGESVLSDFAQAYLLAIEASPEIQAHFLKVATEFRIEKRQELIDLMSASSSSDLYKSYKKQIDALAVKLGIKASDSKGLTRTQDGKTLVNQSAQLREAVYINDTDAIHFALENGARIDDTDTELRNALHIAAENGRAEAMTLLLSQLRCSNADLVLLQKDGNGFSPFALAAILPKERSQTLRLMSEFLLSGQACQTIAKTEIREWVKAGSDELIKKAFTVFSEIAHGVEVISEINYRLLGGDFAAKVPGWLEQSLCQEAKDHVWARIYFEAIFQRDDIRKLAAREAVRTYSDVERRQIVGFMLFLTSGQTDKSIRENIFGEAESLQLPRAMFEGSSDNVADIKSALDEIVTGQENAKISLAVAVRNHYERVEKGLKKSNILILGPSGSGKTLLVQTIAKKLDVPFALFDATNITQAGYVGGKASDAVAMLAEKGGFDKEKIERGIIFLDEIDKMASRSGRSESDEFKRQGQASLLKMLEGIEVDIPLGRFDSIKIDTSNILFVCAGAFTGLPEIIQTRLKGEGRTIGDNAFEQAMAEDLIRYGMAPEFLGRLPNVITLKHLSVNDMVHILKNPKASVLEEYRALFTSRGVDIKFTDGAILAIAERAVTFNVGARALRTVAESVISDLQFRVGQMGMLKSITVTDRVVKFGDMPTLEYKTGE